MSRSQCSASRRLLASRVALAILLICTIGPRAYGSSQASSQPSASLTEWTIPTTGSGPWSLTLDPSGKCCWFLEYVGNKLAHLDPSNNTLQEWALPTSGANPYNLATTMNSGSLAVWGTESGTDKIFAFSPSYSSFSEYSLSKYNSGLLGVAYLSVEPSSAQTRVWFTESLNNANGELIVDPNTRNATLYVDSFPRPVGGGAYGVYAGSNVVWYAGFSALVQWSRATQLYSIWSLPVHGLAAGRFVTLDKYGEPWYTQGVADGQGRDNLVGVLRGNGTLQEWRVPDVGSDLQQISIDPVTQRPWVAEQSRAAGNGSIVNLDGSGGSIYSISPYTVKSGGAPTTVGPMSANASVSVNVVTPTTVPIFGLQRGPFTRYALGNSLPRDSVVDSSGNVWISEPGANKIARLSLTGPDFALLAPPLSSLQQGQSGTVTVSATSIAGYSGQVTLKMTRYFQSFQVNSISVNPLDITPGTMMSSTLTITIAPNATGLHNLLIQGTDGNITHSIILFLNVLSSSSTGAGPPASKCFIATAAYGSELSPEVELLRNFRDNSLSKTRIGSSFLIVFNAWYYSFSPYVADYLHSHAVARTAMRDFLYPLIAFIFFSSILFTELSAYPELATILSGLLVIMLIGVFYMGLPLSVVMRLRPTRKLSMKAPVILFLVSLMITLLGQAIDSKELLMVAVPMSVLFALWASTILTLRIVLRLNLRIGNRIRNLFNSRFNT